MKKHLPTIIFAVIFFVGLSVLLYPTIANLWNSRTQTQAIVKYEDTVSKLTKKELADEREKAVVYNEALRAVTYPFVEYGQVSGYDDILNFDGNGVIGYITIEKIKVELPIYHGASDEILNFAVGHLQGSSLPVGGESTHAVLSAHRGLPSAKLFSDLDKMEKGDEFSITVLDQVLRYRIDQILIVEPEEIAALGIVEGKDYCSLITCTPYGINTHRLIVRGERITGENNQLPYVPNDAYRINAVIVALVFAGIMLFIVFVVILIRYRTGKTVFPRRKKQD